MHTTHESTALLQRLQIKYLPNPIYRQARLTKRYLRYDPWLIYRNVFHKPFLQYIKMKLFYLLIVIVNCVLVYAICSMIRFSNQWVAFCLHALLCAVIPNIVLIAVFRSNYEFKALYAHTREFFKRIRKNKSYT